MILKALYDLAVREDLVPDLILKLNPFLGLFVSEMEANSSE